MSNEPVEKTVEELEAMSAEEIRALAEKATPSRVGPTSKPKTQAKVEPVVEDAEEKDVEEDDDDEQPEEEEYEYRIDLADGSGVQVFKGSSPEEVMDKLGEAQKHATKKIREQAEQLKRFSAQAEKEAADNEYVYGQELMTKPTEAFKKLFKETTGVDINTFKNKWERVEAWEQAQQVNAVEEKKNFAATNFISSHPEYIPNKQNGTKLEKAVNLLVADAERKNEEPDFVAFLEEAYLDLSESGLLQLKSEEAAPAAEVEKSEPVKEAVKVVAHTRRASGLAQRSAAVSRRTTEPTEEELYNMPLERLKELANRRPE